MTISHMIWDKLPTKNRYLLQIETDTAWNFVEITEEDFFDLKKTAEILGTRREIIGDYVRTRYEV
jgi:hypothetical protein